MSTCKATTAAGKTCTAAAKHGSFCGRHAGSAARSATVSAGTAARAEEQERLFAKAASNMKKASPLNLEVARNLKILGLNAATRNAETIKKAFRTLALA